MKQQPDTPRVSGEFWKWLRYFRYECLVLTGIVLFVVFLSVGIILESWQTLHLKRMSQNLRWVGKALHSYHDTYECFPPLVVRDETGRELHSWRSLITPILLQDLDQEISSSIQEYDFRKPWDDVVNLRAEKSHPLRNSYYDFLAVAGPEAAWLEHGSRQLADFTDQRSDTILLLGLRKTGLGWYEPVDIQVSASGGLMLNGAEVDLSRDVFVLTADGKVKYLPEGIDPRILPALLTIQGGETVSAEW